MQPRATARPFEHIPSMRSDTQQDAFLQQLQPHRAMLYQIANAYCARREDRGDLIQDIVLALWRAYPRFDARAAFSTWMHQIAVNVAISQFRGERRRIRDALPIDEPGLDLSAADDALAPDRDLYALHQLTATLDAIDRALVLLYLAGYGHDEIAAVVGLSNTNVATRIHRIKQRLQKMYAHQEPSA
jgi:RNA polymerase sigma factor (sigma-70 family)